MNSAAVVIVDMIFGALLAPLSLILAGQLGLSRWGALLVGLIVALDPTSIVYSGYLGPEPLANLTFLAALVALLAAVNRPDNPRFHVISGVSAGLALGVSMLARPASYLLFIPLGAWLLLQYRVVWRAVLAFMVIAGLFMGSWIWHNGQQFATYSFSSIGTYNILYYRAASVEKFASHQPMDAVYAELSRRVEEQLGHDTSTVTDQTRHGHYAATAETQQAMLKTARDVFLAAPGYYIATIPIGLARMFLITNSWPRWLKPIEVAWNMALLIGMVSGLWVAIRRRQWLLFWCVFLLVAYFTGGTLVVQTSGMDTRMRTMLTPLLAAATANALLAASAWWRNRQRRSAG